ncbi:hypothetical protein LCGC14_2133600, partial [marine sediment metagenome]
MGKINCNYEDEITCPHCGYKDTDSWETQESGETSCNSCSKKFHVEIEHSTTYSSSCGEDDNACDFVDQPTENHPDYQECSRCENTHFK